MSNLSGVHGEGTTLLGRPADQYLDAAANELAAVKREMLRRLDIGPGQQILDVGCGNGTDVLDIARHVGDTGKAVGVDVSDEAISGAIARGIAANAPATFLVASAYSLPFPDARFDAVRAERMVQHLVDPVAAVAEMLRVTRPGGRVLVADPDHGMWAPDLSDRESTRAVLAWWFDNIRNPWIGRRLAGVLRSAGAEEIRTTLLPVAMVGVPAANGLTGLMEAFERAGDAGVISREQARRLRQEAAQRDVEGGFVMYGAMVLAEGRKPS